MYAHFYRLSESPFNLTPDPKFHFVNESTREALASLLHGIRARKGFITLIAEAGTGKTTMLKRVVDEIEGDTRVVFVFNPGVSFDELLEFICTELEIRTDSRKRLHLLERLNQYLLDQLTDGCNVVVMIDEAQTLESSVLEELRLLSNLETSKEKILQIVLSGQPELEEKLRRPQLRQLRQRIGVRCTLKPMHAEEIGAYIETRLRGAGAERSDFFTPVALRKVWSASGGIPRVINAVCDNAMMIAFAEGKKRIDSRVIKEAVRDLHGGDAGEGWGSGLRDRLSHPYARYVAAAVLALAFIVPTAVDLLRGWHTLSTQQQLAGVTTDSGSGLAAVPQAIVDPGPPPKASREPAAATEVVADERGGASSETSSASRTADSDPIARPARVVNGDDPLEHNSAVLATIRRAELMARATAARIYAGRRGSLEDSASGRPSESAPVGAVVSAADASRGAPTREGRAQESIVEVVGRDGFVGDAEQRAAVEEEARRQLAAQQMAAEKAAAERAAAQKAAAKRAAAEQAAAEKAAAERAAAQKAAAERAAAEQAAAEKAAAERAAAQKAAAERAAAEQAAAEKAAAERAAAQKLAAERAVADEESVRVASAKSGKADERRRGVNDQAVSAAAAESAARLASVNATGPAVGEVLVGRHVLVEPGATIWDIAIGFYGSAGPSTLTRLLNNNPGVRDPRALAEGAHVFVPFANSGQMVRQDSDQTFRVLLTVTPLRSVIDDVRFWIEREGFDVTLGMATLKGPETTYQLYALGVATRAAAAALARRVLEARDAVGDRQQNA